MPECATEKATSLWRDEDGSALVEATIVMPLLISLFLGVFEFSWFFYNQQLVVSGLRDAARYMTRIELTDGNRDPCAQKDRTASSTRTMQPTLQPPLSPPRRLSARQRLDLSRRHNQLPFEHRPRGRRLRRWRSMTIIESPLASPIPHSGCLRLWD